MSSDAPCHKAERELERWMRQTCWLTNRKKWYNRNDTAVYTQFCDGAGPADDEEDETRREDDGGRRRKKEQGATRRTPRCLCTAIMLRWKERTCSR